MIDITLSIYMSLFVIYFQYRLVLRQTLMHIEEFQMSLQSMKLSNNDQQIQNYFCPLLTHVDIVPFL